MNRILVYCAAAVSAALITWSARAESQTGAYLGVSTALVEPAVAEHLDLPPGVGLVVRHVDENAAAAGALQENDILRQFDDQLLVNQHQLAVLVRGRKPGDQVSLSIIRKGKPMDVGVTLGEHELPDLDTLGSSPTIKIPPPVMKGFPSYNTPNWSELHDQITEQIREQFGRISNIEFDFEALQERIRSNMPSFQLGLDAGFNVPTNHAFRKQFNSSQATVSITEGDLTLTLNVKDEERHLRAERADGTVEYDGPVNTADEVAKLPETIRALYEDMEANTHISTFNFGPKFQSSFSIVKPRHGRKASSAHASSRHSARSVSRDGLSVTITEDDHGATVKAVDEAGEVVYEGPYNTDEEKQRAPDAVRELLQKHKQPKKVKGTLKHIRGGELDLL